MKTLRFKNGDLMPAIGLGTWRLKKGDVSKVIKKAVKLGYRHIDCAHAYGNEAEIGEALSDIFRRGIVSREEMFITSKLWCDSHHKEDVEPALRVTLNDLQIDYLDLYLMHWPVALKKGVYSVNSAHDFFHLDDMPLSDTWEAIENTVDKGLVKHIGVSNFKIGKIKKLALHAGIKPELNQIELHPYLQQNKLLQYCRENDILLTAYTPLGSVDRTAKSIAENNPILIDDPIIIEIAKKRKIKPAQVLISWALQRDTAAIPKSVNPKRMKQNLKSDSIVLEKHELDEIAKLDRDHRYISGDFWLVENGPYSLAEFWD